MLFSASIMNFEKQKKKKIAPFNENDLLTFYSMCVSVCIHHKTKLEFSLPIAKTSAQKKNSFFFSFLHSVFLVRIFGILPFLLHGITRVFFFFFFLPLQNFFSNRRKKSRFAKVILNIFLRSAREIRVADEMRI